MHGHHEFDLFEAIYTTRSMRRLKPDPVEPGLIVKVIEAATMGPSGHNRQPWFFIVVTEQETKFLSPSDITKRGRPYSRRRSARLSPTILKASAGEI